MKQLPHGLSAPESDPFPFGQNLEAITHALGAWVLRVIETSSSDPDGTLDFYGIPLTAWRRGLDEWCGQRFVQRAHGSELTRGLQAALRDFDDPTLLRFLESLV